MTNIPINITLHFYFALRNHIMILTVVVYFLNTISLSKSLFWHSFLCSLIVVKVVSHRNYSVC